MRWLEAAASLLVAAALLWGGATPAKACDCGPPADEGGLREFLQYYDLVMLGAVAESPSAQMQIDVERVYHGSPIARVTLDQPSRPDVGENTSSLEISGGDCGYTVLGEPGERYLLVLTRSPDGTTFKASSCGSRSLEVINRVPEAEVYFSTVEVVSGSGIDPRDAPRSESKGNDVPVVPLAIAAVAIPLAFVLAASFVFPARGSRQ